MCPVRAADIEGHEHFTNISHECDNSIVAGGLRGRPRCAACVAGGLRGRLRCAALLVVFPANGFLFARAV